MGNHLVAFVGEGFELELDVVDAPDELIESVVRVGMQGGARDDEEPSGVPDRASHQPAGGGHLVRVNALTALGVIGAEIADPAAFTENPIQTALAAASLP